MDLNRTRLLDLAVAGCLLYVGIWVYELANLLALSAFGSQANLVFSGPLPIGVSAVAPTANLLVFAKPAQIGLATLAMLGLFLKVKSRGLRFSSDVAITTMSIYLASAYFELLSSIGTLSYEVHIGIFSSLAIGAQLALSNRLKLH